MSFQTARQRIELERFKERHVTMAGWFWAGYLVVMVLVAISLADLVTRWFA